MAKKRKRTGRRSGLQAVTLCISIALVLILLGLVVFFGFTGRNLSRYVKENLVVTVMFEQDMTTPEAQKVCNNLQQRPYIKQMTFISKEDALKEATKEMGVDPSEFTNGVNPFSSSLELTMKSEYANNDSLAWISKELKKYPKVTEINYQKDFIDTVNRNLAKIGIALLVLAALLTFVSFSLINNTVRLGIYARRFSIHTMKLVGASWNFIRWPFVRRALLIGVIAALVACAVLAGAIYALCRYALGEAPTAEEIDQLMTIVNWQSLALTGVAVLLFGIIITGICANISVNKFLKMKAGELYKI